MKLCINIFQIVQESVRTIEPLLCLRRVSLNLAKSIAANRMPGTVPTLETLIGECWLQSAKTARAAGVSTTFFSVFLVMYEFNYQTE